MQFVKNLLMVLLIIAFSIAISSCSKGKSPVEPVINDGDDVSQNLPVSFGSEPDNRNVLCVYDAVIDPDAKTFTIEPANRSGEYHFPLTQMYPNVMQITGYGWTPNFWADIKLTHPYPESGIDAFDPRVIAILPANPGVSFNYPLFNVQANNSVVMEPDGYTKLFDWVNLLITGNTNPFVAYFKDEPNRVWSSTGVTEETQRWQMDISGFSGPLQFELVVDVSTNYPNPPQPVIDNMLEPAIIHFEISDGLNPVGGSADVTATFLDWQGASEIKCKVEAPDLYTGSVQLFYSEPGPNPDEYIFTGTISNDLGSSPDDYAILLAAWDINVGNHVFYESTASVQGLNPIDITPPHFTFSPRDIFADGNYLYIAGADNALHISDVSDPANPIWVNRVPTPRYTMSVHVSAEYAYLACWTGGLKIIDIDPPESAYIANTVITPGKASCVYVVDGYAYVVDHNGDLHIIDIAPVQDAHIVNTVEINHDIPNLHVSNGYAYISTSNFSFTQFQIVDVDPPESAYVVKTVYPGGWLGGIDVSGGYAYVADRNQGLRVIDIDPPEDAHLHDSIPNGSDMDVQLEGDYAFSVGNSGLSVIQLDPLRSLYHIGSGTWDISICNGHAYTSDDNSLRIIDIDPAIPPSHVKTITTPTTAYDVQVSGEYAYVAYDSGLKIVEIDPPQDMNIVNSVGAYGAEELVLQDGYAFVARYYGGFSIIDIDPPGDAFEVISLNTPGYDHGVYSSGEYAYVACDTEGLHIIDIDPIESASIIYSIDTPGNAEGVFVSGGYAYVADGESGLQIIDISEPLSATIVHSVDTPGYANGVYVMDGYAYVADDESGLQIICISEPLSATIVHSVDTPAAAFDFFISGGYGYVADGESGVQIIDLNQPDEAFIVDFIDTPDIASGVYVTGEYAYLADENGGLRIIDLW